MNYSQEIVFGWNLFLGAAEPRPQVSVISGTKTPVKENKEEIMSHVLLKDLVLRFE